MGEGVFHCMNTKKRITDPVHGSVLLTDFEADVVATRTFQRLHNVRQLGLAYYVFPAGNYSRFSHSLGACHNAAAMISAVKRNVKKPDAIKRAEEFERAIRLGALLHDLGHYPFSHATEHVVASYYSKLRMDSGGDIENKLASTITSQHIDSNENPLDHETLGDLIIENDPELQRVFEKHQMNLLTRQ